MTPAYVSMIIKKGKKNPKFLEELASEQERRDNRDQRIEQQVSKMQSTGTFIDSVEFVKE